MEPLPAQLMLNDGRATTAPWSRVAGPFFVAMNAYRTNEYNDGAFEIHSAPPGETGCDVELREYIKMQAVLARLVGILSRTPEAPAVVEGAPQRQRQQRDDVEDSEPDEAEPEPQPEGAAPPADRPQLVNLYVVPVCGDRDDVMPLLCANAADPAVVDYRGIHGFAWYLVTRCELFNETSQTGRAMNSPSCLKSVVFTIEPFLYDASHSTAPKALQGSVKIMFG